MTTITLWVSDDGQVLEKAPEAPCRRFVKADLPAADMWSEGHSPSVETRAPIEFTAYRWRVNSDNPFLAAKEEARLRQVISETGKLWKRALGVEQALEAAAA